MSPRLPLAAGAALLFTLGSAAFSLGCDSTFPIDTGPGGAGGAGAGGGGGSAGGAAVGGAGGSALLSDGVFFWLIDLDAPVGTQMQLCGDVRIDAETGAVRAQLTNANRNPAPDLCPSPCKETQVCRTIPAPECVVPSTKADGPDEYPDFVVVADPPIGYSFTAEGWAADMEDGSALLTMSAAKVVIVQPAVEIDDLTLWCTFAPSADGVLRCAGGTSAVAVAFGDVEAGAASGSASGRVIPLGEAPAGLPAPPE